MAAQVRELGVRLKTHFATERLNTGVYVCVLFKTRAGGKCFATVGTGVRSGADMLRTDVPLKVRRIGEYLFAVLAGIAPALVVCDLMSD